MSAMAVRVESKLWHGDVGKSRGQRFEHRAKSYTKRPSALINPPPGDKVLMQRRSHLSAGAKVREVKMKPCRHFAIAATLLLCSIAAASAAGTGPFLVASDELVLTGAQEHLMWQRLVGRNAGSTTTPSGLIAAIGATLPA